MLALHHLGIGFELVALVSDQKEFGRVDLVHHLDRPDHVLECHTCSNEHDVNGVKCLQAISMSDVDGLVQPWRIEVCQF